MRYRTKPCEIEATPWFGHREHAKVREYESTNGEQPCKHCAVRLKNHGWIDTLEGGHIVCPGDFIVIGLKGEHYPVKPDIFRMKYEEVTP